MSERLLETGEKRSVARVEVDQGLLSLSQIDELLDLQQKTSVRLGEILVQLDFLELEVVALKLEDYHDVLAVERAREETDS